MCQREMLCPQERTANFLAARPLRVPCNRMHQFLAGGRMEHGIYYEGFGEARVVERSLHDSWLASHGSGVDCFNVDCFGVEGFAIHTCDVPQERSGYSPLSDEQILHPFEQRKNARVEIVH